MQNVEVKRRFKQFAIDAAQLTQKLPKSKINDLYCRQLIRSSSSSGANYFAACRAKSPKDFVNKLKIVEEGLDESIFFLELRNYFNPDNRHEIEGNVTEGNQLLSIVVASIKTLRNKRRSNSSFVIRK